MIEKGEPGEETSVVTVLLEQIAKVAVFLALVYLTSLVVRKAFGEPDLF